MLIFAKRGLYGRVIDDRTSKGTLLRNLGPLTILMKQSCQSQFGSKAESEIWLYLYLHHMINISSRPSFVYHIRSSSFQIFDLFLVFVFDTFPSMSTFRLFVLSHLFSFIFRICTILSQAICFITNITIGINNHIIYI